MSDAQTACSADYYYNYTLFEVELYPVFNDNFPGFLKGKFRILLSVDGDEHDCTKARNMKNLSISGIIR